MLEVWLVLLCQALLGFVLVLAGIQKLRRPEPIIEAFPWPPFLKGRLASIGLMIVAATEVILGAMIGSGILLREASISAALLMVAFSLLSRWHFQTFQGCPCFGAIHVLDRSFSQITLRNTVLIALAGVISAAPADLRSVGPVAPLLTLTLLLTLGFIRKVQGSGSDWNVDHDSEATDRHHLSLSRRSLLKRAGAMIGLGALAAANIHAQPAEAACSGCGTCSSSMVWLYCWSPCCAVYYVQPREQCDGYCRTCGTPYEQTFCNVPSCC